QLLAPDKKREDMIKPMSFLKHKIIEHTEEKKIFKAAPNFAPAGQSTQMVIGATPETDLEILFMADQFYQKFKLRRVYYSGYVPISNDNRLPAMGTPVPIVRENRLYQADWLMRFYGFNVNEIVDRDNPLLDMDIDPKLSWALRNLDQFPIDINSADIKLIMRVPGIGVSSAEKICSARRFSKLSWDHLKKIGISVTKARYFVICNSTEYSHRDLMPGTIKQQILSLGKSKYEANFSSQLKLF
ncbi:MAG TPA: hypothetical protein VM187_10900, partial [Niastella sp.]|nr:hypothetical protein [Niastella sp.]